MKYLSFFIAGALIVFSSCKKDNSTDSGSTTSAKTTTIISSSWMVESAVARSGSTELPQTVTPCLTDNVFTFKSDGTGTMTEGANVCAGYSATNNFNWSFANNETALNVTGISINGVAGPFKILELTNTRLSLGKDSTLMGISGTYVVNFKH